MSALRANPPTALGPFPVAAVVDLATARPATDALVLTLAGGGRVVARPSGTEPKIKFYLEATAPTPAGADLELLRSTADAQLAAIRTGLGAAISQIAGAAGRVG
jgi:phosphomannomutase